MTMEIFSKCYGFLQATFGKQKPELLKAHAEILKDLDDETLLRATKGILKNFTPTAACTFPAPAHFFEYSGNDNSSNAQELIGMVRKSVRTCGAYMSMDFGSPALHSVIDRWGGWEKICDWGQEEWDINEGRFRVALESAINSGDIGPERLKGIHEKENGYLLPAYFIKVRKIKGEVKYLEHTNMEVIQ